LIVFNSVVSVVCCLSNPNLFMALVVTMTALVWLAGFLCGWWFDDAGVLLLSTAGMVPLTPTDGSVAQPYGSDYAQAVAGNFTFQITCQDLDETTAAALYAALNGQYFKAGLNFAYTSKNCSLVVVYNAGVLLFVHFFVCSGLCT
jgi:hypothetical protein